MNATRVMLWLAMALSLACEEKTSTDPASLDRGFRTDREIACGKICWLASDDDQYECLRDCLDWSCLAGGRMSERGSDLRASGMGLKEIAGRLRVTKDMVRDVVKGRTWSHVSNR